MVEPEVPDGSVDHSIRGQSHDRSNNGASNKVVPVVIFVNGQGAGDEGCAKNWCVQGDQLPHCWVMVGEDFEFGIQVKVEEGKASPLGRRDVSKMA